MYLHTPTHRPVPTQTNSSHHQPSPCIWMVQTILRSVGIVLAGIVQLAHHTLVCWLHCLASSSQRLPRGSLRAFGGPFLLLPFWCSSRTPVPFCFCLLGLPYPFGLPCSHYLSKLLATKRRGVLTVIAQCIVGRVSHVSPGIQCSWSPPPRHPTGPPPQNTHITTI